MRKPVIGVTAPTKKLAINFSANQTGTWIAIAYLDLVRRSGGIPVVLPINADQDAREVMNSLDGLLLSGGEDVCPELYGQEQKVEYSAAVSGMGTPYHRTLLMKPDRARDESELALYRAARELKRPVFGICRGAQLINVAEGGTLFQELVESHVAHELDPDGWVHYHDIRVHRDTRAFQILDRSELMVPSIHHQGIDKLAPTLVASAHSDDGLVEIIELAHPSDFVMGVQGHIEKTSKNLPAFERMIAAFIREASKQHEGVDG